MKLLLMKQTLQYILAEVTLGNTVAIARMKEFEGMSYEDKKNYLVLTDKVVENG